MAVWTDLTGTNYHDFEDDMFNGENTAFGLWGGDTIYGWTGKDNLSGGDGGDTLHGRAGNDTLRGDSGDDYLWGGADSDRLEGGSGADWLYGGTGGDKLIGGGGNDHLYGQDGNDEMFGHAGVDHLYGGSGYDDFYFGAYDTGNRSGGQADTIYDFSDADQIYLDHNLIGGEYRSVSGTNPGNGEYSIFANGADWVVRFNSPINAGYHDIIVKGGDPHGDISFF